MESQRRWRFLGNRPGRARLDFVWWACRCSTAGWPAGLFKVRAYCNLLLNAAFLNNRVLGNCFPTNSDPDKHEKRFCRSFEYMPEQSHVHIYLIRTALNFATSHLKHPQGKYKEAVPFLERASCIFRKKLGESHHSTVDTRNSLERLRKLVREREALSSCHET